MSDFNYFYVVHLMFNIYALILISGKACFFESLAAYLKKPDEAAAN